MLLAFHFSKIRFLIASNVGEISVLFLPIHTFWYGNSAIKSLILSRGIIISLHRNLLQMIPFSLKLLHQLMVSKEKGLGNDQTLTATLPITAQVWKAKQTPSPPAQSALVSSELSKCKHLLCWHPILGTRAPTLLFPQGATIFFVQQQGSVCPSLP